MENYGKKSKYNKYRVHFEEPKKEYVKMSLNNKPAFVSMLASVLTEKEKFRYWEKGYDITDPRFKTGVDYTTANLPKSFSPTKYNFYYTADDLQEMLSTPKIIIKNASSKYVSESHNDYSVTRFYMLAPWIKNDSLPVIYNLEVLQSPRSEKFFGFRAKAVVGGYKDGDCTLLGLRGGFDGDDAKLFYTEPMKINPLDDERKKFKNIPQDEISDVKSATEYIFKNFNIDFKQKENLSSTKIYEMMDSFRKNGDLYERVDGADFIESFRQIDESARHFDEFVRSNATIGDLNKKDKREL